MALWRFYAALEADGTEGLFVSDGSAAGAVQITVPGSAPTGLDPYNIVVDGAYVVFSGVTASGGAGLFEYNATTGKASEISVAAAAAAGLDPWGFTVAGSSVLFSGTDASGNNALFAFTPATGAVSEVSVPGAAANINIFNIKNGNSTQVLFAGTSSSGGTGLFVFNPVTGLAAAVTVTGADTSFTPSDMTLAGNDIVFRSTPSLTSAATTNSEIFSYSLLTKTASAVSFAVSGIGLLPEFLTSVGTNVFFSGSNTTLTASGTVTSRGLFRYDTVANTAYQVTISGAGANLSPFDLVSLGTQLVFAGTDVNGNYGLFNYTPATGVSKDLTANFAGQSIYPSDLTVIGNQLLFGGATPTTSHLYEYNQALGQVFEIAVPTDGGTLDPGNLSIAGNNVVFTGTDYAGVVQLYSYSSVSQSVSELTLANSLYDNAHPMDFQSNGTTVSFFAYDQSGFLGQWVTDGTATDTREVVAANGPINPKLSPISLNAVGGDLTFWGLSNSSSSSSLYYYDPTSGASGVVSTDMSNTGVVLGGQLLFGEFLTPSNSGLYAFSSSTNTVAQVTVTSAAAGLNPSNLQVFGNKLYFDGGDTNNQTGLFVYDPTVGTASELAVLQISGSQARSAIVGSSLVYVNAQGGLSRVNITTGQTSSVNTSGLSLSGLGSLVAVGSKIVFTASISSSGTLYSYDPTTGVVTPVPVVAASATNGSLLLDTAVVGSKILFSDSSGLYVYDASTGIAQTVHVSSGASSLQPSNFIVSGSLIFFGGADTNGRTGIFCYNTATGVASEVAVPSAPAVLQLVGVTAYGSQILIAANATNGPAFYSYDATANAASLIETVPGNNFITAPSIVGNRLLFGLSTGPAGDEALYSFMPSTGAVAQVAIPGQLDGGPLLAHSKVPSGFSLTAGGSTTDDGNGGGAESGNDNGAANGNDNGPDNSNGVGDNGSNSYSLPSPTINPGSPGLVSNGGTATLGTATPGSGYDPLTASLISDSRLASSQVLISNGSIYYIPGTITANQVGSDTLTYVVTDQVTGASVQQTQTIALSNGPGPTVVPLVPTSVVTNGGTIALAFASPGFPGTDALALSPVSETAIASGSTIWLVGGTIEYSPGLITSSNVGSDTISYGVTDTVTGAVTLQTQTITLGRGPAPIVTLLASPAIYNGLTPALATSVAGYGTDALTATLTSDSVFGSGAGVIIVNGTIDYLPGTFVAGSPDTITYTVTDTVTGAVTSETQTVTLKPGSSVAISGAAASAGPVSTTTEQPFAGVTVIDQLAGQTETASVMLSNAGNGVMSNLGGGSYNAATGIYRITGSAAAVTAAIDGLLFTQTPSLVAQGQTVSTGFTITVTDTAGQTATNAITTVVATAPYPVLAITSAVQSAQPVQGSVTPYVFTVTRSGNVSGVATANWAVTAGGVAGTLGAAASDFSGGVRPAGTVTFAAGQTTQTITVNAIGAQAVGYNDSFTVALSGASSGTVISNATDAGVIFGYSTGIALGGSSVSAQPPGGSVTPYVFTVTRSGSTAGTTTAQWAVTAGGVAGTLGAAASDFAGGVLPSGTVSFAAGQTTQTVTVNVAGAQAAGFNDSFKVALSNVSSGAEITNATEAGIIFGYGTAIALGGSPVSAQPPGGSVTPYVFTVTRSGSTAGTTTAQWAVTAGGVAGTLGAAASDFSGGVLPSGTVSFAAGQTTQTITVNVAGAQAAGFNDSFKVALSNVSSGAEIINATEAGIIFGYGTAIALAGSPVSAQPPGGSVTPYVFTVTRSGSTAGATTAQWAVTAGGVAGTLGAAASDFSGGVLPSGTVSFAAGQTAQTVTVNVAGAQAAGFNDSFKVALSNVSSGAEIINATEAGIIFGYGTAIALAGSPVSAQPPGGSVTPYVFTVTRSGSTAGATTAQWAVTAGGVAGTLGAAASDFSGGVLPSGTVSFAAGQTTQTITVNVAGAQAAGFNDSFKVALSNVSSGAEIINATEAGIIFGYPTVVSIAAVKPVQQAASGAVTPYTFTVIRSGAITGTTVVNWSVSGGTWPGTLSSGAKDFSGAALPAGTVTFAAGQTTQTITISVVGVGNALFNDSFSVNLASPSSSTELGVASASAVILAPTASAEAPLTQTSAPEMTVIVAPNSLTTAVPAFVTPPTILNLDATAQTVSLLFDGGSRVEEINDAQFGRDVFYINLGGAANSDLIGFDASVDGRAGIVLTTATDLAQGVALFGLGPGSTAASLLADHTSFKNGHAIIT